MGGVGQWHGMRVWTVFDNYHSTVVASRQAGTCGAVSDISAAWCWQACQLQRATATPHACPSQEADISAPVRKGQYLYYSRTYEGERAWVWTMMQRCKDAWQRCSAGVSLSINTMLALIVCTQPLYLIPTHSHPPCHPHHPPSQASSTAATAPLIPTLSHSPITLPFPHLLISPTSSLSGLQYRSHCRRKVPASQIHRCPSVDDVMDESMDEQVMLDENKARDGDG